MSDVVPAEGVVDALEQSLVKVPAESLNQVFRQAHKTLEKEINSVQSTFKDLAGKSNANPADTVKTLRQVVARLESLKRKMSESFEEEDRLLHVCRSRTDHLLEGYANQGTDEMKLWTKTRIERMITGYLLSEGFLDTARILSSEAHIQAFTDDDLFTTAWKIQESLKARNCAEALSWCSIQRSHLKKIDSKLEFQLHVQQFAELCRVRDLMGAIKYARKNLTPFATDEVGDVETVMGLLAFGPDTTCLRYKKFYDDSRWDRLVELFVEDNLKLNSMSAVSNLAITLQTGLSALKIHHCYLPADKSPHCPVCDTIMNKLAENLPHSHRTRSSIVCRISGEIIDENNPAMVLPNNRVYGRKALQNMAKENNGKIVCPQTLSEYRLTDAKKVFIM